MKLFNTVVRFLSDLLIPGGRMFCASRFMSIAIVSLVPMLGYGTASARYDVNGNDISGDTGPVTGEGDICGTCPAATGDTGVDFKGNDLLGYAPGYNGGDDNIRRYQSCGEVDSIVLHPAPTAGFDIGYDSLRDRYIVTDSAQHLLLIYASDGSQVGSFAAIGNPVGATYDAGRDVYWACDWISNQIYAVNATSGVIGPVFAAPAGTRIAGTGYDAANDAIAYNARDQATGYWMSAANGSLIASYAIPLAGKNNGQGCGVDPTTTNVWLSHAEQPFVYCIFGLGPIAISPVSWGSIKANYR